METIKHDPKCRCVVCVAKATRPQVGMDLTMKQKRAAATLLKRRPAVLPGTRAILIEKEAAAWHDRVTVAAIELKLNPQQIQAFCDACGVAD